MDMVKKLTMPPWPAVILGVPAFAAMLWLQNGGRDDRGLLVAGHPSEILLWVLTALMAAVTVWQVWPLGGKTRYGRMFPASGMGAGGIAAAAIGMLAAAWNIWSSGAGLLEAAGAVLGLAAGLALFCLAWCRHQGVRGSYLLWAAVTAFLMLRLMFLYRGWSAQPELMNYCFPLLASVCLSLAMYHRTAFAVGMGSRRMYLFFTQMGAFCGLAAAGVGNDLFYLWLALWCVLDLPSLRRMKHAAAPAEQPEEQP